MNRTPARNIYNPNNLSSHASLLLSASPTIITSPLQSNMSSEEFINFKKPQNEIFKKLDGKIQKIVAAHSNLNKLYALNDFAGLGAKRPFELPGQLPPPPPWVPKAISPDVSSWTEEALNRINLSMVNASPPVPSISIDSVVAKLHQRRKQQQRPPQKPHVNLRQLAAASEQQHQLQQQQNRHQSQSSNNDRTPTISAAQFAQLAQKIKLTLQNERSSKSQGGNLSEDDTKKFQENLVALLEKEIAAIARRSQQQQPQQHQQQQYRPQRAPLVQPERRSLLQDSSPQTLYNRIRRQTSLLLNKRSKPQPSSRSSLSLLMDNSPSREFNNPSREMNSAINSRQQSHRYYFMKVVIPPTELNPNSRFYESKLGSDSNSKNGSNKLMNLKSRKPKKFDQTFGLRINNYSERECPQREIGDLTIEQYAFGLNLVPKNDASLLRRKEQLQQPPSNRPLRFRRIRGERLHMTASARNWRVAK